MSKNLNWIGNLARAISTVTEVIHGIREKAKLRRQERLLKKIAEAECHLNK